MSEVVFTSVLGPYIERFIGEKRALGYRYEKQEFLLRAFDRHLVDIGHQTVDMPKAVSETWTPQTASWPSRKGSVVENVSLDHLHAPTLLEWLDYLEAARGCSPRSRNQRMATVRASFWYPLGAMMDR